MKRLTILACTIALCCGLQAQVLWDKEKYPDYDPTPHVNQKDMARMKQRMAARRAEGKPTRPDHWNNALTNAFPPVMNQSAGSCGSASRIYYMFSHEMNAARWADGSKSENIYPTHFTWLLTWVSNQGKEVIAQHNGIPNSSVYGGYTYSELFGYQDCDDGQSNYGWMQGYDKWFHAMNNRIISSANFAMPLNTEEGREIVKNYLWNHCGDETYSTGGIVGIGVASGGNWQKIPKTTTNDALGVTNMYYVKNWGESVDHALTIVGYDDRIEFDLDGNGVKGEADKDEVGAWIIVNSWGNGWCNGGFIYCPYAEARPTATTTGYWTPEYYTPRRDYRPLRTLKVKMDYSHRSEMALYVGYSTKLTATKPDKEVWLRHFYYSGLGKGVTVNASNPDPAIPMLGKWADGELHSEPMEFGYDLTDLVDGVDPTTPLKFFFRVETRSWAKGEGHIYNASIIDYALDPEGIETPFEIPEGGQLIANKGKKTTITTVARAESVPAPRNLSITPIYLYQLPSAGQLEWQAPLGNQYEVEGYRIYCNGTLQASVDGNTLQTMVEATGTYTVKAVYRINGQECLSPDSEAAFFGGQDSATAPNTCLQLAEGAQVAIPRFNADNTNQFTIEFWLRPTALSTKADNFGMKASSGKFFFKVNKSKRIEIGFDGGDYTTSSRAITADTWQHIAIVANSGNLRVYLNGSSIIDFSSSYSNTVGSVANLTLGITEGTTTNYKETYAAPWTGVIDELRVWSSNLTASTIKKNMRETYVYPALSTNLTCYYKMDTRTQGDALYLVDAVGGRDASITQPELVSQLVETDEATMLTFTSTAATNFNVSASVTIGQPVTLETQCAPGTTSWTWTITGADIQTTNACNPVVTFTEMGEQTVKLFTLNRNGEQTELEKTLQVNAAEAPVADFTVSATEIAAGDHVSFINTSTPLADCTYRWTLTGADIEDVRTVNAAATYAATGTYTVRLTAINAAGESTVEKQIEVVKVAPQPAFDIQNNVAIVGENIFLIDQTRYDPSQWTWIVSSDSYNYVVNGQSSSLSIDRPGTYAVTLRAANEKGANSLTRARAITVCAQDGQTGLKFDAEDDEVTTAPPFGDSRITRFSIEWWMYPGALAESGMRIGDSADNLLLTTNAIGTMTVTVANKSASTDVGYVIDNEWHHYAITFSSGTTNCYRDGVLFQTIKLGTSGVPAMEQFALGGASAPMNAIIDEFRVWKKTLTQTQLRSYANGSIENIEEATDLALYYDFNQSTGDVIDRSSNQFTGQRHNFGPDGDAWTSSRGIFCLNFESTAKDVTATYLKNYKAPFTATSKFINGTSRFKQLATGTKTSPWVQENSVVENGITTEFHVDANKNSYLTLSTTWDGFASEVKNLKLYQTVTLPAGAYELTTTTDKESNPGANYLVAAAGEGLPDYADCESQALAISRADKAMRFILNEETTVSLGILSNMSGQACHTIQKFQLRSIGFESKEADMVDAVREIRSELAAMPTLSARGGLGTVIIEVSEPQTVKLYGIAGQLRWSSFVEGRARVSMPKGIYVVGRQKVLVK